MEIATADQTSFLNGNCKLTGAAPFSNGLCFFTDTRGCFQIPFPDRIQTCYDDNVSKIGSHLSNGIVMHSYGSHMYCFIMLNELAQRINLLETVTVDLSTVEQILIDRVVDVIQYNMGVGVRDRQEEELVDCLFVGGPSGGCFRIVVERSMYKLNWLKTIGDQEADKSPCLLHGSGAIFAEPPLNACLTKDCSETEDEIISKIVVAANKAMLETDTCGGSLKISTFLHKDAAAVSYSLSHPLTISPIQIQLGDSDSFGRVLLLRVSVFLSDTPFIYKDRIIQKVQEKFGTAAEGEAGIRCITYFFTTNRYRFWRIVVDGAAQDLLNKIVDRLGMHLVEAEDNFFPIGGLNDNDEIAIARCEALKHPCPCFNDY